MLREHTLTLTHSFKKEIVRCALLHLPQGWCVFVHTNVLSDTICMQYQCCWLLVCSQIALKGIRKHSTALALKHLFRSYTTKALTELIISPGLNKHLRHDSRSFFSLRSDSMPHAGNELIFALIISFKWAGWKMAQTYRQVQSKPRLQNAVHQKGAREGEQLKPVRYKQTLTQFIASVHHWHHWPISFQGHDNAARTLWPK